MGIQLFHSFQNLSKTLLVSLVICAFNVYAFSINPKEKLLELSLDSSIYTFSKSDSNQSLATINPKSFPTLFKRQINFTYQFGYNTDWHWIAIPMKNRTSEIKEYYLVVQNAMIESLDLFQVETNTGKIINESATGFSLPFESREIKESQFVFKIKLLPNREQHIYLRANLSAGNLMVPLRLFTPEGYLDYQSFHNKITSLTANIWIIACIGALLLYFIFTEKIYLYYFGYVFCLMMYWCAYEGITFQLLWPNSAYLADISRDFYAPAAVSFAAFAMSILTTNGRKLRIIRKMIQWISWAFLPVTLLVCIPTEYMPIRNQLVGMMDFLLIGLISIILYAITIKLLEKNEYTKLLIVAMSPMLVYTIIQLLTFRGLLPIPRTNPFIQYGFGICAVIEILFMFILLAYRIRNIINNYRLTKLKLSQTTDLLSDYQEAIKIRKTGSYIGSKYTQEELQELITTIDNLMENKKLYRNSDLSLQKLAEIVNCSPHLVSQCVNQIFGSNFNDYINSFRIKESESMLTSSNFDHISIEGIGIEVGFASKTSFYTTFKKLHNMTPKEFKLTNQKS